MIEKREKYISLKADFFSLVSSPRVPCFSVCGLLCGWKHSSDSRGVSIKSRFVNTVLLCILICTVSSASKLRSENTRVIQNEDRAVDVLHVDDICSSVFSFYLKSLQLLSS